MAETENGDSQLRNRPPEEPENDDWAGEAAVSSMQEREQTAPPPRAAEPGFLELDNPFRNTVSVGDGPTAPSASSTAEPSAEAKAARVKEFSQWLQSNFGQLDADRNGQLSVAEVEKKMLDPKFAQGRNAVNLASLHQNLENLAHTFGKGKDDRDALRNAPIDTGDEKEKPLELTADAAAKFHKLASDPNFFKNNERALAVSGLARNFDNFNSTDERSPYQLTPTEVDQALKRTDLSQSQRDALQELRKHQAHLLTKKYESSYTQDGKEYVSDDKPNSPFQSFGLRSDQGNLNQNQIGSYASDEARAMSGVFNTLHSGQRRLEDGQKPENRNRISQGTDGSCFFLAPLIGMQQSDPKALDRMMKKNDDGSYTVTFPGDPKNPITIGKPTDAEMANWASGERAAIFEKALGEYYAKMYPTKPGERPREGSDSLIPSARIQGGNTADSWKLLTGRTATTFNAQGKSEQELRDFLKGAKDKPMSADTRPYLPGSSGMVSRHSYAIRFDEANDRVIFENPVKPISPNDNDSKYPHEPHRADGRPLDGTNDGVFSLPVSEAKKYLWRVNHP